MSEQFTKLEWAISTEPIVLLAFAAGRNAPPGAVRPEVLMSERKLRLFLVACCRAHWERFTDAECREAIECAERIADGQGFASELDTRELQLSAMAEEAEARLREARSTAESHLMLMTTYARRAAECTCRPFADLIHQLTALGRSPNFVPIHPRHRVIRADYGIGDICKAVREHHLHIHGDEGTNWKRVVQEVERGQAEIIRDIVGNPFRPVALDPAWRTSDVFLLARGIYDDRAFDRMPILADALQDAGCDNDNILSHCHNTNQVHARGCWVVDLLLGKE
jgi:hypothetical protein